MGMSLSSPANQTVPRTRNLWPLIVFLGLVATCLIALWITRLPKPNRNALAIGEAAKVESVIIDIQPPV
jgi:hypothetical protein